MSKKRTLLRNARVLQGDAFALSAGPQDLLVEAGRIAAIAPAGQLGQAEQVVDLTDHLLVPGLVNGHQHSHEHFQRGRTENLPLELWMQLVRTRTPASASPPCCRPMTMRASGRCWASR